MNDKKTYIKPHVNIEKNVIELITDRWSPRAFSSQQVTRHQMDSLFEAARWAASANNEQPWRFIYAFREDEEKFAKILGCLNEKNQVWAKGASVLVITVVKTFFEYKHRKNDWAYHDLGLAVGNMLIQATSMGLYAHNMAGISIKEIKSRFEIPEGFEPHTAIALGHLGDRNMLDEELKSREEEVRERMRIEEFILE